MPNAKNTLSIRLSAEEYERFVEVFNSAKERFVYISQTRVIRELFGLEHLSGVTEEERAYFQQGSVENRPITEGEKEALKLLRTAKNEKERQQALKLLDKSKGKT